MADQPKGRITDLILVAGLFLVILIGVPWLIAILVPSNGPADVPDSELVATAYEQYVGPQACNECHPGAYAYYTNSGHARTIRPVTERQIARELDGQTVEDPERPGVLWSYLLSDDRFSVERIEGEERERIPIDYAFGSGHHATTFLTLTDPTPDRPRALEHRLTHLTEGNCLAVTPGQRADSGLDRDGAMGHELTAEETLKCFGCHTTTTSAAGPSELDLTTMIPNVTCERCHGPGRHHIEAARRGDDTLSMPFGYGTWTAEEQMRLCGDCHRHPSKAPPGIIRPDNLQLARFQPVGIMQSPCYTESHGTFSCVSCHNPHDRSQPDHQFYENICMNCHKTPTETAPFDAAPTGCIDCHMPTVDSGQGVLFTDHWIRVREDRLGQGVCTRPGSDASGDPSP